MESCHLGFIRRPAFAMLFLFIGISVIFFPIVNAAELSRDRNGLSAIIADRNQDFASRTNSLAQLLKEDSTEARNLIVQQLGILPTAPSGYRLIVLTNQAEEGGHPAFVETNCFEVKLIRVAGAISSADIVDALIRVFKRAELPEEIRVQAGRELIEFIPWSRGLPWKPYTYAPSSPQFLAQTNPAIFNTREIRKSVLELLKRELADYSPQVATNRIGILSFARHSSSNIAARIRKDLQ